LSPWLWKGFLEHLDGLKLKVAGTLSEPSLPL